MKIAVFGENPNDTKAIRELILGIRPDLSPGDIRTIRTPPTLTRDASSRAIQSWAEKAQAALKGAAATSGAADWVFAHTDADGPDDGTFAQSRVAELRSAGLVNAVAVVPVQAIESWWLLFPEATESVVASWRGALRRGSYSTDSLNEPKGELVRRTRNKQPKRPYEEADSPAIARAIATSYAASVPKANSLSFRRFESDVLAC